MMKSLFAIIVLTACVVVTDIRDVNADEPLSVTRIDLRPGMVVNESQIGDASGLVDEQAAIIGPPAGSPRMKWAFNAKYLKEMPFHAHLDLGQIRNLSTLNTEDAYQAMRERKAAAAQLAAERKAKLAAARAEMRRRPLVDAGPPFGKLFLIDEVSAVDKTPGFHEYPLGVSRVQTILGTPCRVLEPVKGEASHITYRIGKFKLLQPGMTYVLQVEYPEDKPRTMVVINRGNETSRGFHTGPTIGDALHAKYVDPIAESINTPLTGEYETWQMMFNLHDRTPGIPMLRGANPRELTAEDGFYVTVSQYSAENLPMSAGIAVSRIRLLAVPEPGKYDLTINTPKGLPKRRIFWREEMSDGVIASEKEEERGVKQPLDWWRFKANQMRFLGMNTFSKDLLEFGACQHWDSSEYGGNSWVYYNRFHKDLWGNIVTLMGQAGFDVLPYYEYSGSKGQNGLGQKKLCKPLTRDDAYTHIQWIQDYNADITDLATYVDFKKMLDLTILRHTEKAEFVGAWIRQRSFLAIGFGDSTRHRFAREANNGTDISRKQLIDDKALLQRYYTWWFGKRRQFFEAMRDHLRQNGIPEAKILYTADASEPGIGFNTWEHILPTDLPEAWQTLAETPEHIDGNGRKIQPQSISSIVKNHLYLEALQAWKLNWGDWEINHSGPPSDPSNYQGVEGVMLSHGFNKVFTVSDPRTFETFRNPTGLTLMRHYGLNENMMFDKEDKPILGYFVADMEKAGPYCMQSEALAMAHGDPTWIGYLNSLSHARGFPYYVRNFNQAFLALPALPSTIVPSAASNRDIVVRSIKTAKHGTYLSIVNTGMSDATKVTVNLPVRGRINDAATGVAMTADEDTVILSFYPYQLRVIQVQ
jgi:hypothetical protein